MKNLCPFVEQEAGGTIEKVTKGNKGAKLWIDILGGEN